MSVPLQSIDSNINSNVNVSRKRSNAVDGVELGRDDPKHVCLNVGLV